MLFFLSRYFLQSGAHGLDSHHRDASHPPNPLDPFGRGGEICTYDYYPREGGGNSGPLRVIFFGGTSRSKRGCGGLGGGGHLLLT